MADNNPQYDSFGNINVSLASNNLPPPEGLVSDPVGNPTAPSSLLSGTYVSSLNVDTSGNIRSGQTDYNTGMGWWIGNVKGTAKLSLGDGGVSKYLTWDGTNLTINGFVVTGKGAFGGDGSDGALNITSGATNINLGAAAIVVKNYTSISITGTGSLTFSNPHANGTIIVLKSQGNVTLTSSTAPMIDASGMGAAGGAVATVGNDPNAILSGTPHGLGGAAAGAGEAGGAALTFLPYYAKTNVFNKVVNIIPGAGGGGGANASGGDAGGVGGNGGGALRIECGGAWNFTTTSGISVAGSNGANGAHAVANQRGGGGGGGGAGGMFLGLYKTLTANTGTVNTAGGTGGSSPGLAGGTGGTGGSGGSGAGSYGGVGGAGAAENTNGGAAAGTSGGGGGAGGSQASSTTGGAGGATDNVLIVQNTEFA